jgi:hypothetical protein
MNIYDTLNELVDEAYDKAGVNQGRVDELASELRHFIRWALDSNIED